MRCKLVINRVVSDGARVSWIGVNVWTGRSTVGLLLGRVRGRCVCPKPRCVQLRRFLAQ